MPVTAWRTVAGFHLAKKCVSYGVSWVLEYVYLEMAFPRVTKKYSQGSSFPSFPWSFGFFQEYVFLGFVLQSAVPKKSTRSTVRCTLTLYM